jgi:hypothetical protein
MLLNIQSVKQQARVVEPKFKATLYPKKHFMEYLQPSAYLFELLLPVLTDKISYSSHT